jgi:hypothetical protein
MLNHRHIDARSRALAIAVADQLRHQPELVDVAKRNIAAWMKGSSSGVRSALAEWDIALNGSIDEVIGLLTSEGENSVRLRQSNPFAGVLSSKQRTEILNRFLDHDTVST